MKLGEIELLAISDGIFGLDGGAMFGIIPKPLWEKQSPADSKNRIRCGTNLLLIIENDRKILIDAGIGDRWNEKEMGIYAIDKSETSLLESLHSHGVAPEEITDVIVTHIHFDHQGGAVRWNERGELVPTFPNATYHYQKEHLAWARKPTIRDRASFRPDDFEPVFEAGCGLVHDGAYELTDHVKIEVKNGHTTGLQTVRIDTPNTTVYYCSDMIPLSPHIRLPFIMGYDLRPLVTLEEKNEVLEQAAANDWILFLEHDPDIVAVKVEKGVKDFSVSKRISAKQFNQPALEE